jgi:hypothetical protein
MESNNYLFIQISFVLTTIIFGGWFLKEILSGLKASSLESKSKLRNWILGGVFSWLLFASALSLSGFLQDFSSMPPRLTIVLFVPLVSIILIMRSSALGEILRQIPPRNLLRLQVFRVAVEILLWMLFVENLLPVQMTFEGRNFDVIAGLAGPLVAYLFQRNRKVMIAYNFIGLALLLNIVTIAILSVPTPFRVFMNEPANTIVTYFPIVLLPAFLVPMAYTLHFFSLKQLLNKK